MNIYCFTTILGFIHSARGYIEITGELTFDVQQADTPVGKQARVRGNSGERGGETTAGLEDSPERQRVNESTVKDECMYRLPDGKQVDALLSDMMNHLTKIFVRAFDYMGIRERGTDDKRFKIINKTFDSRFFEEAYNLMSKEYRQSINKTADVKKLSRHDPCRHQRDIKRVWQNLLDHSKDTLRRAAVRCISDFLRVKNRADDTRTKEKLGQLLLREIKEVRSNQLKVLCDEFNLCYKDLLKDN